jgi:hypothetical protein
VILVEGSDFALPARYIDHQSFEIFLVNMRAKSIGMTHNPDDSVFQGKAARALRSNEFADVLIYHTKRLT